jgi:crossover junction endodeoxyribonuclease RusA
LAVARRSKPQGPPHDTPLFDICVHGQPISSQSKQRRLLEAWRATVRRECETAWPRDEPPLRGRIRLRVTFYFETRAGDMDNIRKPIQDALQGIVYVNDKQVTEGTDRCFDINGPFVARWWSRRLGLAFSDGRPFVHIEVWVDPDQESVR